MPTQHMEDYKLSAVKYYLKNNKNIEIDIQNKRITSSSLYIKPSIYNYYEIF